MVQKRKPAIHLIESDAELKDFVDDSGNVTCMAFLDSDVDLQNIVSHASDLVLPDIRFSISPSNLASKYGAKAGDLAIVTRFGDEPVTKLLPLTSATTTSNILKFVAIYGKELIMPLTQSGLNNIFRQADQGIVITFIFISPDDDVTLPHFKEPAEALIEGIVHISVVLGPQTDAVEEDETPLERVLADFFGINDLPVAVAIDTSTLKYIKYEGSLNSADVELWERGVLDGTIKPQLNSEEPEADDLKNTVKVVRGKTFDSVVIDNDKNVLLLVYAKWCGHCKQFMPIYQKVGEKLAERTDIIVAMIDGDANDIVHPKIEIQGFPTLYYFTGSKKNKHVTEYLEADDDADAFSLDAVVAFVEQNTAAPKDDKAGEL